MPTPPVPPMIQTLPQLLLQALPPPFPTPSLDALAAALSSFTLKELETALKGKDGGRQAVLSQLKSAGVERIGDRQKIANTLAKADRLGTLKPYLDEATAMSSGLAEGKCAPYPYAPTSKAWMENATSLKQRGNDAFKSGTQDSHAVDLWGAAVDAVSKAIEADGSSGGKGAQTMLVSLHANRAAAHLRLQQWPEAIESASAAIALDGAHAKALFRRGVAHKALRNRTEAKRDVVASIKADPKNREAREALAALETEKEKSKASFREAFQKELATSYDQDGEESEEVVAAAWRAECERLRGVKVDVTDDTPPPITLVNFRRQRAEKRRASQAKAKAAQEEAEERMRTAAREAAKRDGVDVEALDALYASLRSEGVDTSDPAALHQALLARGVDPSDRDELEAFARSHAKESIAYASGGFSWAPPAEPAAAAPEPQIIDLRGLQGNGGAQSKELALQAATTPSPKSEDGGDDEEISTESMYSLSSWGK
jgi:tetratricopeptide (TPR) repeat protein